MAELPQIEWQEKSNIDDNCKTKKTIIKSLEEQIKFKLSDNEHFYFIAPESARNVSLLTEKFETLKLFNINKNRIKIVNYGYKNRGWGIIFKKQSYLSY